MSAPRSQLHCDMGLADACRQLALANTNSAFVTLDNGERHEVRLCDLVDWLSQWIAPDTPLRQLVNGAEQRARIQALASHQALEARLDFTCDLDGKYLYVSPSLARLLGAAPASLLGQDSAGLFPPELATAMGRWQHSVVTSAQPATHRTTIATGAGARDFLLQLTPIQLDGSPVGVCGTLVPLPDALEPKTAYRAAENELETIFQSLPDLFFRLAADGTILDYRAQTRSDLYVAPELFLGRRMQDVLPADLGQMFADQLITHKATGQLVRYEYDLPLDGGVAHFEARLRDLPGTDQFIVIVRNTTQQHREHLARLRAEQQLKMALEAAQEGVWDWNIAEGTWSANATFFEMLGYPPESGPQPIQDWNNKIFPADRPRRDAAYQIMLKRPDKGLQVEFRAINSAGQDQWIRARGKVVERDAHGKALRAVGTHEEITERKALEERLKLAATVFENTAEGVIIATPRGYILDVNKGFVEVTGFTRDEVIGRHVRVLNSGRQAPTFYRTIWRALLTHGSWKGEVWNRHKSGQLIPEWLNINAVYDDNKAISHFVAVFSDISMLKRSEEKLDYMAHHDALTRLPNRLLLQARLGRALVHAHRNKSMLALLFLDVDRFKTINDSMGHPVGDEILKQVAKRLLSAVRGEDTVARLGGDEFVVLLEGLPSADAAAQIADKILAAIREPFAVKDTDFFTSTSIGISLFPSNGTSPSELLRNADSAMYQVKKAGRDAYAFYNKHLTTTAKKKTEMESELHRAISNNELTLLFQPQLNLETELLVGMEALVRWQHPVKGMIAPDLFIPLAEESALILKIGEWVYDAACAQLRQWLDQGLNPPRLAVNVSGAELLQGDLLGTINKAMSKHRIRGSQLEVEITENFMIQDIDKSIALINNLRDLGITIAIDDFGTGYSSLAYLKQLPIHRLKIDRAFIGELPANLNDAAIARAIIAMGESLGMEILAEGIETREQQAFLRTQNCHYGQGYLFSRPLDVPAMEEWLKRCP